MELEFDVKLTIQILEERIHKLENSPFAKSNTYVPLFERLENVEKALENYRQYKTDIEDLETDVMYIKKNIEKLEKNLSGDYLLMATSKEFSDIKSMVDDLSKWESKNNARIEKLECRAKEIERFQDIMHEQYKRVVKHPEADEELHIEVELHEIKQQIECLFISLKGIETKLMGHVFPPMPYKCPVCDGTGKSFLDPNSPLSGIEGAFLPRDQRGLAYTHCHPCKTTGVIWK